MIPVLLIIFAVLAWRDFKTALILLLGLLPTYLLRFSIGPLPMTALEGMILIATAVWIARTRPWRDGGMLKNIRDVAGNVPTGPIMIIMLAATIGVIVAQDHVAALGIWKAYFVEPMLVALMIASTFKTSNNWRKALLALGASAAVVSIVAIVQVATGKGIPAPWDLELRATGLYDFPNALGLFVAPIVAALIFAQGKERILAAIGIIGIVLSKTEAALVAIPAALAITGIVALRRTGRSVTIPMVAILIAATTTLLIPAIREKLFLQDISGQARLSQWRETTHLLTSSPRYFIFGAGLSGYPTAIKPFHDATVFEIFQYPHNIILNIWVELGLLGLVGFAWLAAIVIRGVVRADPSVGPNVYVASAALTTMTIHGLVDVPYFKNDLAVLTWFFIVMIFVQIKERPTVE